MRCSTCDETTPTVKTLFGDNLCLGCEALDSRPLHPVLEASLRLEMMDERAEEMRDEEELCQQ